nr:RNA-directed DNA polymerase, eukaryota, reverse transcriptase zinc-binding domain protein [Tanacetum cinerariifolium]
MKALKIVIKEWSLNQKDAKTRLKEDLISKIKSLDADFANGSSSTDGHDQRATCIDNLRQIEHDKSIDSSQKAKIKWCVEADDNTKFFHAMVNQKRRGLCQGDPLYPFLFIIAMEGLHVAMEDAMDAGLYNGFKINNTSLSYLFFADDALFIVSHLASITGCNALLSPFDYLGIPINSNMALVKSWDPIIEKFSKRLSNWKASLLSIGGRATLISSVLGAICTYYFSLFPMLNLVSYGSEYRCTVYGGVEM